MTPATLPLSSAAAASTALIGLAVLVFLIGRWRSLKKDSPHHHQHYKVPERDENLQENPLYRRVSAYVASLASIEDSDFANLFSNKFNEYSLRPDPDQTVRDSFLGADLSWTFHASNNASSRSFVLTVRKRDRRRILRPYLHHIQAVSDEIELKRREIRLYTTSGSPDGRWRSVPFTHPSTIETVAMDQDLKNRVRTDLESFLKNRQYYHHLGRVWKRSYLLYGPSGTGKSSFVAAMARFLNYDLYDFDLSRIISGGGGSDLKSLLIGTTPRSLIVVEDLDRYLNRPEDMDLSTVLNFMDGIVSCCGEERVMVFTMNSRDNVDPAILRPGRLDSHVYFPLCDFTAFKSLASSYLGLKDHKLYPQVEEVFSAGGSLSPAEVGEILIANRGSPSRAIKTVICALQHSGRASAAKIGGRRLFDGGPAAAEVVEEEETVGLMCAEGPPALREIKKLYGLLKRGGSRKESVSLPVSGPLTVS
ncbi:hypothetical protein QJS04_geneDACA020104 [Acorus gramineus]|uniref:AAA+ ATPase domain-containing protein n=1 Tax=Acorus gramineus TaxID=55184 RepID=A0AAV8ZZR1_ACOGR|nr:hypothetical protein QJS04_geneDACA020104 [Acorus gramineus]